MSLAISKKELSRALRNFVPAAGLTPTLINSFYESLDTPKSLACYMLFNADEHDQLLELSCDPSNYIDAETFRLDYAAVNFLSKATFLRTAHDKKARAIAKFKDMELRCRETNRRFLREPEQHTHAHGELLIGIRRKIDLILGQFDIDAFFSSPAWGPGSSTLIKGFDVSAARKFQDETGITSDLYALMSPCLSAAYPLWFDRELVRDSSLTIQEGNAVITVPKNSKIDRVIAIEPGINQFFQKSLGQLMRSRLRRWHVDLSDQSRNQKAARAASVSNRIATVDFSSASDTIAYEVVRNLLPQRWFVVADCLRSKRGRIGTESFCWEKFSSMGNGFTFELETLIFYATALVCCEATNSDTSLISVYGDDVIIPSQAFSLFSVVSDMLGFVVSPSKSFFDGPFRESCGSHYFRGVDVKPIFLKEKLSNALSIYKLANNVRRLAHRHAFNHGCDLRFLRCWRDCIQGLPQSLRSLKIPEGYGDGGISSNFDEAAPPIANDGWEGFKTSLVVERGIKVPHETQGLLLSRLHSLGIEAEFQDRRPINYLKASRLSTLAYQNFETLRDRTQLSLVRGVTVPLWYNFGCWQ